MLILKKLAVTGGLSCGKSTACRFFEEFGAYVVSADTIVHQLLSPETSLGQQVISLFGSDILVQGQIDRKCIAERVFKSPERLKALEDLVHPAVRVEISRHHTQAKKRGSFPLFVAEIPLLFEGETSEWYDATVAVIAKENHCIRRFTHATGATREEFNQRASRQMPLSEKAQRADYIIENDGSLQQLKASTKSVFEQVVEYA